MMLKVVRRKFTAESTIGDLYVDNVRECLTLEDVVRTGPKIPGKTAIPEGIYRVVIDYSYHFKKLMPHILDVPNFGGIRIHCGNSAEDTEGCILVGNLEAEDRIAASRAAYDSLYLKIKAALDAKESVFIAVTSQKAREAKANA